MHVHGIRGNAEDRESEIFSGTGFRPEMQYVKYF